MLVPGRKKPIKSNGYGIFAAHEGGLFCRHPGSKARGEFSRQFIKKGLTAGVKPHTQLQIAAFDEVS